MYLFEEGYSLLAFSHKCDVFICCIFQLYSKAQVTVDTEVTLFMNCTI